MTQPHRASRVALSAAVLGVCLSGGAWAADTRPVALAAAQVDPRLEFAAQRDLGIFPGQMQQYLQTERVALARQPEFEREFGGHYAGSWIERKADGSFRYVVATAGAGKAAARTRAAAAGVELRHVKYRLQDLQTSKARLDDLQARAGAGRDALRGIRSWHVDPQSNRVIATVAPDATERAIDFLAASGIDVAQVKLETLAGPLLPQATVRGGIRYDTLDAYCSVGFAVTRGNQKGFVTAGHCLNANQRVWIGGELVGRAAASRFPGTDRAWVQVDDAHRLSPWVKKGENAIGVRGRTEAPLGAVACRSGVRTGYRCGQITAKDVTVHYDTGDVVRNMVRNSACSGAGDSGGSWITPAGQAQGIHSGGTMTAGGNGCNLPADQSRSFYSPLNPILQIYDLRLVIAN